MLLYLRCMGRFTIKYTLNAPPNKKIFAAHMMSVALAVVMRGLDFPGPVAGHLSGRNGRGC